MLRKTYVLKRSSAILDPLTIIRPPILDPPLAPRSLSSSRPRSCYAPSSIVIPSTILDALPVSVLLPSAIIAPSLRPCEFLFRQSVSGTRRNMLERGVDF